MSYEGYEEFLTADGEYFTRDSYDDTPLPEGKVIVWFHRVDETNGLECDEHGHVLPLDQQPEYCIEAPKKEIGFVDEWCVDHYGNKYAVKHLRYAPDGDAWIRHGVHQPAEWES